MDDILKEKRLDSNDKLEFDSDQGIEYQRTILDEDEKDPFVVTFLMNSENEIIGFIARGSTGFVQYGFDIIAAGVSSLSINTVHSIQRLTDDDSEIEMKKNFVKCIVKKRLSRETKVLLKSYRLGIESIQDTYGTRYVSIEELRIEKSKRFFGLLS